MLIFKNPMIIADTKRFKHLKKKTAKLTSFFIILISFFTALTPYKKVN